MPEQNPLISVCLTTYNRAHHLRRAFDSLLSQTYRNFELIISNDASVDDTDAICRGYVAKDARINYFKQRKNLGMQRNFEFVVSKARGKYFLWAADDDFWHERFLEDSLAVFSKNPNLIMVFCGYVDVDDSYRIVKRFNPEKYLPSATDLYERLKKYKLFYFQDGKNQLIYGLWKLDKIADIPIMGYKKNYSAYFWGYSEHWVGRALGRGAVGFVPEIRFFRRSIVGRTPFRKRFFVKRIFLSFGHRLEKIFSNPYFWYEIRFVLGIKELPFWQRLKLVFWNFYVMARLFFVRKI